MTYFFIIASSYYIYKIISTKKWHKELLGSLLISNIIAFSFGIFLIKVPFFNYLEETFHSLKYDWFRNPGNSIHPESGLPYCQAPYDETGKRISKLAPNPPLVRDDIEIIGITNLTIEKLHGNWPIDWGIYATLAQKLSNAENNLLLFDISFLDNKGIYGGNNCGILFKCIPINEDVPLKKQVDVLAEAIANNPNKVLSDYPLETTDEARSKIVNLQKRLEILNQKERLTNIKNGKYAYVWAKLAVPPVEKIAIHLDGLGYANILKPETGVNRQVPIVARIVNTEKMNDPTYDPDKDDYFYPGIDLVAVANYYGINIKKDIEVDFLKGYVKIKNIPKKTIQKLDLSTFEMKEFDIMTKPNPKREIIIPIDRAGRMNINFRGGRYCFKSRELLEMTELEEEEASAYYKDKITLVAMYYATGVGTAKDIHLSPYGDMAGIEHHAYAINTILNQDFAITVPKYINFFIILFISLIMGFYQPLVKTIYNYIFIFLISFIYSIITFYITFNLFSLLHIYPTVIILQFTQLAAFIGFKALTEEENVKFIRTTFSKFVSQDIVEELLNNPDAIALGGSRKEVTVFFSDVRGFTTISERLTPEELVQLLNEYLSEMTELIIDYKGTIDKYMGDAIMAFWGAPIPNDDHAYYACVAALAQVRKLQELQERWKERNIPVLNIGIGINTGPAVVGNMGSSRRMDYTLMGDTVNLGSRLEGITKVYGVQICISEFTYERVKDRVYARELDLVRVKGKLEPVRIYELMGLVNEEDFETLKSTKKTTKES
ncbi:MAG: adenylate/guanylate cyclase domain-containing protein [Leptospiraceae bacterium]|nr:MAG: adenylate/guanylate cyclase domain-containing protein [Leptospiraceae bacterium]